MLGRVAREKILLIDATVDGQRSILGCLKIASADKIACSG